MRRLRAAEKQSQFLPVAGWTQFEILSSKRNGHLQSTVDEKTKPIPAFGWKSEVRNPKSETRACLCKTKPICMSMQAA